MRNVRKYFACLSLATTLALFSQALWSAYVDPDDQKLIDAANCDELIKEHGNYAAAEKEVAEKIRQSRNSTTAGNVLGIATLATFGLGFFSWDDHSDAEENLAELTAYRIAIAAAAKKKSCAL